MKKLHMVTFILLIVGGLNWLLFGLAGTDVGAWLGGMDSGLAKLIYILVGLSAVYELFTHKKCCTMCKGKKDSGAGAPPMPNSSGPMSEPKM